MFAFARLLIFACVTAASSGAFALASDDSVAGLLHREDVQTELKLTPQQLKKWNEIDRIPKPKTGSAFEGDPIAIADPGQIERKNAEREKKAWSILGPSQAVRLMELVIQRQGIRSLLREDVRASLELTEAQAAAVQQAKSRHDMAVVELMRKVASMNTQLGRPDPKKVSDVQATIEKTLIDDLDQIPTQDQRNKLAEMSGKKFTFFEPRYGG